MHSFALRRFWGCVLTACLHAQARADQLPDGFVSFFNGKDLTDGKSTKAASNRFKAPRTGYYLCALTAAAGC